MLPVGEDAAAHLTLPDDQDHHAQGVGGDLAEPGVVAGVPALESRLRRGEGNVRKEIQVDVFGPRRGVGRGDRRQIDHHATRPHLGATQLNPGTLLVPVLGQQGTPAGFGRRSDAKEDPQKQDHHGDPAARSCKRLKNKAFHFFAPLRSLLSLIDKPIGKIGLAPRVSSHAALQASILSETPR